MERLENKALRIEFATADEGFGIRRILNKGANDTPFGHVSTAGASFWEATFWNTTATGEKLSVKLTNVSPCRGRRLEKKGEAGATFIWDGLDLGDEKAVVTVRATVRFAADDTSKWSLEVQNQSALYALAETRYPVLRQVAESGEADVLLPRPDLGARLLPKRPWGERDAYFGCMGYHPMMTAFFKDRRGLYFAAHDSQARIKQLYMSRENDLSFVTPIENAGLPGKAAEGPRYEVTVAALAGDWWSAAKLYRNWALTAPWTAKGRIVERADYPRRICEIPLWLNIHAYPEEVSETMTKAHACFPNTPVGIHWHLWQHSGHDVNYPEYFPEQPGVKETLEYCHSLGCEAMPYVNGRLWSVNLLSYQLVKHLAVTNADGEARVERYGTLTPPMSPMCPYTPQWDDVANDFCSRVLDLGAGSIFIDQVGACAGQACYNPQHNHPLGGGTWYYDGYQALLRKIHANYAQKNAFVTTEGSGEQWMNVIDGYLQVTNRTPDDVPFFHAVYSGYTTYFCSPENQDDDFKSFRAAQTRELLWGQALGWYHPLILEQPDKCALLKSLAEFRQAHLDYFAYGSLLGEVSFLDAVPEMPLTWLGRKAFFMWKVKDAPLSPTVEGHMPAWFGYVWRSAAGDKSMVFLANVGDNTQTLRFAWEDQEYSVTLAAGELRNWPLT
ncbi:MAG: hypothetical protein GX617_04975 [Lentisphaerae bacterium]|nr:hypothetical protein [Lentisphaerota bacterium]